MAAGALLMPVSADSADSTCRDQATERAVIVTPQPSGTADPTASPTVAPAAPASKSKPIATSSQLTAEGSGRPQAVDSQGEPIAGAAQLVFAFGADRDAITRRQA